MTWSRAGNGEKERRGELVSGLTRDVIGTHAQRHDVFGCAWVDRAGARTQWVHRALCLSVFALHGGGERDLGYGDCVD